MKTTTTFPFKGRSLVRVNYYTAHAATRVGCAGGQREGYPEEDHRDEDAPYHVIKVDALIKATGRG